MLAVSLALIVYNLSNHKNKMATYKINNLEWPYQNINYCGTKISHKRLKIAIIDTGIDKSAFKALNIKEYNIDSTKFDNQKSMHGTLISSIICNNSLIKDNNLLKTLEFISIKVGDDDNIIINSLVKGINLAVSLNADIVNLSVGTYKNSPDLEKAITGGIKKGVIFVCASGNDATNQYLYPASYNGVISVSSTDANNNYLANNNRNNKIIMAAPGEKIPTYINNKKYQKYLDGSSPSTAIVTDVIIILKEIKDTLKADDIIDIFKKSCRDLGEKGKDNYYGYGIVDFKTAILYTNNKYN